MARIPFLIVLLAAVMFAACQPRGPVDGDVPAREAEPALVPVAYEVDESEERLESVSLWSSFELMAALESQGLSLAERLGQVASDNSLAALSQAPVFAPLVEVLEQDLEEFRRADPYLGVGVAGNRHRLFDPEWLRSETTHFELVALVNRLDRRPFVEDACGEVRLVYRLAYETEVNGHLVASRLPMTLTVDWLQEAPDGEGCAGTARRWQVKEGATLEEQLGYLLSSEGPATVERLAPGAIHRVQVNLQSVRWPSTVHPTLGGHAEYVLRSFVPGSAGELVVERLENSPDVEALRKDDELREELLQWVMDAENLARIDDGTAILPERFLAERVISVAPRGHGRVANQPFSALFSSAELAESDFSGHRYARSGEGILRRLDDMSCAGCHQGRAVAGFHLLGEDSEATPVANALALAHSPHGFDEIRRRNGLNDREAAGEPGDYGRSFSLRDGDRDGVYGTPCGLSDDATFSSWGCASGLVCKPYDQLARGENHLGICLPEQPGVGDPCEVGVIRTGSAFRRDSVAEAERWSCPDGAVCNTNRVGFPGGMCTTNCRNPGEEGRCGAIAVLQPFNQCLARARPFEECLTEHVSPAGLRGCDEQNPCRHDYLCARNGEGDGVCIPPYFLFQMRVDGHPTDQSRLQQVRDRARRIFRRPEH